MSVVPVDPEVLRARLDRVSDRALRDTLRRVVDRALAWLAESQGINLAGLESRAASTRAADLWGEIEPKVRRLWQGLVELESQMSPLIRADTSSAGLDIAATFELVAVEPDEPSAPGPADDTPTQTAVESPLAARLSDALSAIGFLLSIEVQGLEHRLPALVRLPDGWELVTALQDHMDRLRGAVGASLTGTFSCLPGSSGESAELDASIELVTARELRFRVFELRDEVLRLEARMTSSPPGTWQQPLQDVQQMVARFMFGPGFAWMRAADKLTFIKQRGVLEQVLSFWSPLRAQQARTAVDGLARYLEALETLNQRECLVIHDAHALERVVTNLEAAHSDSDAARPRIAAALAALAEAQGRDKELDVLLSQTLSPGTPVPTAQILRRGREVLASLRGEAQDGAP